MNYTQKGFPMISGTDKVKKQKNELSQGEFNKNLAYEGADNVKKENTQDESNVPVKRSGFGPSSNENLGNMMTRELEDTAE